ncbi:phosphatase PAP2 family protein [Cumulibacter manganitolerans]|uniref:phosphatase PAP2 family protein n=1 Tax=Cumulibacter manganitolerans TaxID=1884992 RepID=UPI001295B478|nr:phosphatase PAP2 family protein [Cumulibacter manganitolerans]
MQARTRPEVAAPGPGDPPWRLPGWVALVVGVLLLAATVTIGEVVRSQGPARTGELAFDVTLSHHRDGVGIVLAETISIVLGPIVGPLLVIVGCIVLWRRHARQTAALLAVLSASGWLVSGLVKVAVHRNRPPTRVVHALLLENAPDSFPSGHTALITAVFAAMFTIAWMVGRPIAQRVGVALVGVVVVAAVATSRLYLGVHYFYDVLAAPLVAVGGVLVAGFVAPRLMLMLAGRSTHAARWLSLDGFATRQPSR